LSWNRFPPFGSSPKGEPLIGERMRQVADFPVLEAGGWKLTARFRIRVFAFARRVVTTPKTTLKTFVLFAFFVVQRPNFA
jgi:hypothetical protein